MSLLAQRKKKPSGKEGGVSSSKSFTPDGLADLSAGSIVIGKRHQQQQLNRFLSKTFHMVNSIDVDVASWNVNGDSFVIEDIDEFSKTTLPLYFNHSNYSSFVRQLNFYGFSKVRQDCSPLKKEEEEKQQTVCFYHEYFRKDRPDLLHKIHRVTKKCRNNDPMSDDGQRRIRELQREVDAVHDEVRILQSQMESKLVEVKRSMQQEYEKRIANLEETCMGMIVLLQSSSTRTCSSSSSPNTPSSLSSYPHSHSSILGGHSSSCLSSSSLPTSMISPQGVLSSSRSLFWPSATIMAPATSLRRGSWGTASSSSTTTGPVPPPPQHQHHQDPTTHAPSSTSTTTSLLFSPGTKHIKSSDATTLMMLSAAGLIR